MKIVHFIPELNLYSGVTVFGIEVANGQSAAGHDVQIVYSADDSCLSAARVRTRRAPSVSGLAGSADVVHIHALWMWCLVRSMLYCWWHRIPYVVSTHGGLMPRVFTKGRLKKFLCWHLLLKPLLKRASALHCTSEAEVSACKGLGLTVPFVVAPLGVRMPEMVMAEGEAEDAERTRTILFLGRIGEEKGLLTLLSAWKRVHGEEVGRRWQLKIAGPDWRNYKRFLEAKIASERISEVTFTGAADDAMRDRLYREAELYVLPSPMENFSMGVLEALSYGLPVIATRGTPWEAVARERCGLWIDQGEEALYDALSRLMALSDVERREMGARGRVLAATEYQWDSTVERLLRGYRAVCGK